MKVRRESNGRSILVTGGAGFLGSHLCERLLHAGHHIICLDSLETGSLRNIAHLIENPRFAFLEQDITDPLNVEVAEIYNLACPASPVCYQRDPVRTVKTNVQGAINVLDLAKQWGAKILQASTSEVYGDPSIHPQPETYWGNSNPIGLRACYDEGKRCAETLFFDYHRQYGVAIKVARIFNTYGPRMSPEDGRVVSSFIVQALKGQPLTIFGDGSQSRSFCYVDDLVEALILLMNSPSAVTGPINLGNPEELSMNELAGAVLDATGSSSQKQYAPLPVDDPRHRRPDITLALEHLQWKPRIGLAEGLARTVRHLERQIDADQTA